MLFGKISVEISQGNSLTRTSSGNTRPQKVSYQPAEWLWTDPDLKSGLDLLMTDERSQSAPGYTHASFDSQQGVTKARGSVVFENDSEAFSDCADWTVSWNLRGVVYFACLSGWKYLSPKERSHAVRELTST